VICIKCFISVFLCIFLLVCLCIPAFAVNIIRLEYQDWLWFYDILDTEDNYALWFDMYSYGGEQIILPIDVNEDEYNAKLALYAVKDSESEAPSESDTSESDNGSFDSGSVLYPDSESDSNFSLSPETAGQVAGTTKSPVLLAENVPTSGQSYIQPEMVSIEYAPDASSGSLLSVLYNLLGKPIVSYTYKVQSSYDNSRVGYVTQHLEYDSNWLASLVLLLVVVFCIFKAGGALISKA
jgi:hypothetical protein